MQFHETQYGHRFFNKQLPDLIKSIKDLTDTLGKTVGTQACPDAERIFICYCECHDYHDTEYSKIYGMRATTNRSKAVSWFLDQVEDASKSQFLPLDPETVWLTNLNNDLEASSFASLPVYKNGNQNASNKYRIYIRAVANMND